MQTLQEMQFTIALLSKASRDLLRRILIRLIPLDDEIKLNCVEYSIEE